MTASSDQRPASLVAHDGLRIAYAAAGSAGPLVVFVHATGFCKEVCGPVIADTRALGVEFRAVAIDQRAHGDSGTPAAPFDWWDSGRDILDVVAASARAGIEMTQDAPSGGEASPIIGVGHSSGGAALVLAELLRPGTFATLVLVEPIIFPPPYRRFPDHPMVKTARRRRPGFTSRAAAFGTYMSKRAFRGWEERVMWAYVNGGFRDDGDRVVLKCAPESEAEFFAAAGTHGAWDRLGEVETPTVVIAGERSATHGEAFLAELTARFANAHYVIERDASHFIWMERPGVIARHVAAAIEG